MATGRTTLNHWRAYIGGYDVSGYTRNFGALSCVFDEGVDDAVTLSVKSTLPGQATISMGTLNGLFDNTATSGLHSLMNGAGVNRNVMLAAGIRAAPANNDPVFCGQFTQLGYYAEPDQNPVYASIPFGNSAVVAPNLAYSNPWGALLHAPAAETAANSAAGLDQLAATAKGGWMMYQIFSAVGTGNITAAIKVQDSVDQTDGNFSDLLSTGVLNLGSGGTFGVPVSGIVALANSATVKRYVRFQVSLTLATSVTFAVAFIRGN